MITKDRLMKSFFISLVSIFLISCSTTIIKKDGVKIKGKVKGSDEENVYMDYTEVPRKEIETIKHPKGLLIAGGILAGVAILIDQISDCSTAYYYEEDVSSCKQGKVLWYGLAGGLLIPGYIARNDSIEKSGNFQPKTTFSDPIFVPNLKVTKNDKSIGGSMVYRF